VIDAMKSRSHPMMTMMNPPVTRARARYHSDGDGGNTNSRTLGVIDSSVNPVSLSDDLMSDDGRSRTMNNSHNF
jgi:hypothetical protein